MPSNELYITVDEVIGRMEIDPAEIAEDTQPLNFEVIQSFIDEGESEAKSILGRANLSISSVDDATLTMFRRVVLNYAVSSSLGTAGQRGTVLQTQAYAEYNDALEKLQSRAAHLTTRSGENTKSNAPANGRRPRFSGRNYEF